MKTFEKFTVTLMKLSGGSALEPNHPPALPDRQNRGWLVELDPLANAVHLALAAATGGSIAEHLRLRYWT